MKKKEKQKRLAIFFIIVLSFIVLVAALSLSRNTNTFRNSVIIIKGPVYVVKSFYIAANHGRYNEAISYMTKDARNTFSLLGSQMYDELASMSRKGIKIRNLITMSNKVYNTIAYVTIKINYMDGISETKTATLLKENGVWRISSK
jgi:hypothetical protein